MATEQGILWPAVFAAAPAVAASQAASVFEIPAGEYALATVFSVLGILLRHGYEASRTSQINFKAFGIDLLTAPALGILAYTGCRYFQIEPLIVPGVCVLISFLGPEWLRSMAAGIGDIVLGKLRGKAP